MSALGRARALEVNWNRSTPLFEWARFVAQLAHEPGRWRRFRGAQNRTVFAGAMISLLRRQFPAVEWAGVVVGHRPRRIEIYGRARIVGEEAPPLLARGRPLGRRPA